MLVKRPLHSTYHIVIENGKRVLISDCKRINEYTPEKIEVTLHGGSVTVCGQGLTLCDFFGDEIQIGGKVEGVLLKGEKL
ncbi:MAG: hypothetical protein E7626_05595 [Ruminococcaceae bacterium]|nr:hypothetical protein [Oscillospiraceae bacterium]